MPELPEVEVTRLSFAHRIAGATITALELGKPLRWPLGVPPEQLHGLQVLGVRRRSKYLLLDLSQGMLILHLGMSGSLRFDTALPPASPHDHLHLHTNLGTLRLRDPRRFGAAVYAPFGEADPVAQKLLAHLGMEPFAPDFSADYFYQGLRGKSAAIKQVLLGGQIVVGVGNIYCSEALFAARIHPATAAGRISKARAQRLHAAVIATLQKALEQGGSTLKDFRNADGEIGYFTLHAAVYGRAGLPCPTCGSAIAKIEQNQRSTYYCRRCQR